MQEAHQNINNGSGFWNLRVMMSQVVAIKIVFLFIGKRLWMKIMKQLKHYK